MAALVRVLRGALLVLALCAAPAARAAEQAVTLAGLAVTVWSPPDADAPQPALIFSHGYHGCATQSRFLTAALAAQGYWVFAPNHRDASCDGGTAPRRERPTPPFRDAAAWSETSFRERADDIRGLIAAIRADPRYRRADLSHLGLVGHSLGGYTVLGLGGAWPGWKLDGVRAVLALSPYSQPFVAQHTLAGLAAPVMYQGGGRDFGVTPTVRMDGGAYAQSPRPKYYVEFPDAGHFAWTELRDADHAAITAYALAFLDRYVKGAPAAPLLTAPPAGGITLRYDSELGERGP